MLAAISEQSVPNEIHLIKSERSIYDSGVTPNSTSGDIRALHGPPAWISLDQNVGNFWRSPFSNGLVSENFYNELGQIEHRQCRQAGLIAPVITLGQLLLDLSKNSNGRKHILNILGECELFQFCDPLRIRVQLTPSDLGHIPLALAHPHPYSIKLQLLSALSLGELRLWLSSAIERTNAQSDELVAELSQVRTRSSLLILTYNVWGTCGVAGFEKLFNFKSLAPERFTRIGEHLRTSRYDIVTLQEMWDPKTRELIEESKFPYAFIGDQRPGMYQRNGLVTLSRFPIIDSELTPFQSRCGHERFVRKSILRTRVKKPDGTALDVYNTHMVSPPEKIGFGLTTEFFNRILRDPHSQTIRLRQAGELVRMVKKTQSLSPDIPYLIMGDFNAPEGSAEYRFLTSSLGQDLYRRRLPVLNPHLPISELRQGRTYDTERNRWAKGRDEPCYRLDYILSAPGLLDCTAVAVRQRFNSTENCFSDHYGVEASVKFFNREVSYAASKSGFDRFN